jgi:hypothetical protein
MRGKCGRCLRLTTLPPSCADCLEIWKPQPPGTLRACLGLKMVLLYLFICHSATLSATNPTWIDPGSNVLCFAPNTYASYCRYAESGRFSWPGGMSLVQDADSGKTDETERVSCLTARADLLCFIFFLMARQPLGGLGLLIFRGFKITHFRHTTLCRTPLYE